jgi:hypothetical protein
MFKTGHGRGIVTTRVDCLFSDIDMVGKDHVVPYSPGLFEIGVGEAARGIVGCHQLGSYFDWKSLSPNDVLIGGKPNAASAGAGGVVCTYT